MRVRAWLTGIPITTALVIALAAPAEAQRAGGRWDVEPYGGVSVPLASAGSVMLPPAGAPIVTSSPTSPSRAVPSWFFGDGAALLNGANAEFDVPPRITPLDTVFHALDLGPAASAGVRVRRQLTRRYSAEIDVGLSTGRDPGRDLGIAVEATRASFVSAFSGLLASGPFANVDVTATGASTRGHVRDVHATFALNRRLPPWHALEPYVTFGGGILTSAGALPSATLDGRYAFTILGQVPIDESDHVTMREERGAAIVAVGGAGVTHAVGRHWALRADARWLLGPDPTRILIDAAPSFVEGAPAGFVESGTDPAIQFSNAPSTGRVSSLSSAPAHAVRVFSGGFQMRTIITIGIVRRF